MRLAQPHRYGTTCRRRVSSHRAGQLVLLPKERVHEHNNNAIMHTVVTMNDMKRSLVSLPQVPINYPFDSDYMLLDNLPLHPRTILRSNKLGPSRYVDYVDYLTGRLNCISQIITTSRGTMMLYGIHTVILTNCFRSKSFLSTVPLCLYPKPSEPLGP